MEFQTDSKKSIRNVGPGANELTSDLEGKMELVNACPKEML